MREALSFGRHRERVRDARALRDALSDFQQLQQKSQVKALLSKAETTWEELRDAKTLLWKEKGLCAADLGSLGMLAKADALPNLRRLFLPLNCFGGEGVSLLAAALGRDALPALSALEIGANEIGDAGAVALASALARGALPSLKRLGLSRNRIGAPGMAALAVPLRQLPSLESLRLSDNNIGDDGVATLLPRRDGRPLGDAFCSLETLRLEANHIGDAGCAALTAALEDGTLPALAQLHLEKNSCSPAAAAQCRLSLEMRRRVAAAADARFHQAMAETRSVCSSDEEGERLSLSLRSSRSVSLSGFW